MDRVDEYRRLLLGLFRRHEQQSARAVGPAGVETVFAARVMTGIPHADQEETSDAGFFDPTEIEGLPCYPHFLEIHNAVGQVPAQSYFKPPTWRPPGV